MPFIGFKDIKKKVINFITEEGKEEGSLVKISTSTTGTNRKIIELEP
jgi:hypothetical protein